MTTTAHIDSLDAYFWASAARNGDRPALFVGGCGYSYTKLGLAVVAVADALDKSGAAQRVGVLARRGLAAFAGLLGVLASGRSYVPINPKFPAERNRTVIRLAGLDTVIGNAADLLAFASALGEPADAPRYLALLGSEQDKYGDEYRAQGIVAITAEPGTSVAAAQRAANARLPTEAVAYVMFTSGTTGLPKGVAITHANVRHYVDTLLSRYAFNARDRFSQTFDLTFDLSVHDMFLCWASGACLCVLPDSALMAPAKFIRDQALTVWFSVPSTVGFMQRLGQLGDAVFPTLRYSLFCGEALPVESARAWQSAAPVSSIDNLYGPTEATIAFTSYRWRGTEQPTELRGGLVPIGEPLPGLEVAVLDAAHEPVADGEQGELYLGGPQLSPGYLDDPARTAQAFVSLQLAGKRAARWYRSGDLVCVGTGGQLHFLGRVDHQVKVLGHRVELGEIEQVVRAASGSSLVAALPWPLNPAGASGICVFICGSHIDRAAVINACKAALPPYMVPGELHQLETLPLNANGKIDRNKLHEWLKGNDSD